MGDPGGLLSMGLHRVGHDWSDLATAAAAAVILNPCYKCLWLCAYATETLVSLSLFWYCVKWLSVCVFKIHFVRHSMPCYVLFLDSHVQLSATPWTVSCQAPLSMEFLQARILEWVAIPFSGDLPHPGIEPRSPALQVDSLSSEPPGKSIGIL